VAFFVLLRVFFAAMRESPEYQRTTRPQLLQDGR
jgi:hypothetical protein